MSTFYRNKNETFLLWIARIWFKYNNINIQIVQLIKPLPSYLDYITNNLINYDL